MKKVLKYLIVPIGICALFIGIIRLTDSANVSLPAQGEKVEAYDYQYSEIITLIKSNKISEITLNTDSGRLKYKLRDSGEEEVYYLSNPDYFHSDISEFINENNIKYVGDDSKTIKINYKSSTAAKALLTVFPSVATFVLFLILSKKIINMLNERNRIAGGKNGDKKDIFGQKNRLKDNRSKIKFADVAGAEEEKEELREIVEYLKNPKVYNDAGARVPKGVLLVGPPGTGKTLLARAVAGETNVPFFTASGSDFVEMYVGVGASRVRNLFEQAKRVAPSIIFIDEIDAVGGKREGSHKSGSNDEKEQTLNQLLVEMDGFSKSENVIVLAATNRPDVLDPALLRPGRFDRQVTVNLPDIKGREQILKIHGKNKKFSNNVDFGKIASDIVGFSGADIENLLNEAALKSIKEKRTEIRQEDIEESIVKVMMGPEKKSVVISTEDKRTTSYHEAGHAITAYCLKTQDEVEQISIIPRGISAGHTMFKPKGDNSHLSRKYLEDQICVMLGGRAAEDIFCNQTHTGVSNDIKRATELARRMVTEWAVDDNSLSYKGPDCAEETKRIVDSRIDDVLSAAYKKTFEILSKNSNKLDKVAQILVTKEKMSGIEFRNIMSEK